MMRCVSLAIALLLAGTGAASAQTAPVSSVPVPVPVEPARLAAAQALLAVMMPPEKRDQLMESMIRPSMANIRQSMQQIPNFAEMLSKDAKLAPMFERFLKEQEDRMVETMRAGMPGMMDAMARAYARSFDLGQLAEIRAFFETPTGRIYIARISTIMSDPDVLAWQRDLMSRSIAHMQEDIGKFVADVSASSDSETQ